MRIRVVHVDRHATHDRFLIVARKLEGDKAVACGQDLIREICVGKLKSVNDFTNPLSRVVVDRILIAAMRATEVVLRETY